MRTSMIIFVSLALISCSHRHGGVVASEPADRTRWATRYSDDPQLAGVVVQQYPDCQYEASRYRGRHPAMILYVFQDGRVNQVGFEPDGAIHEDFWWTIGPDHYLWAKLQRASAQTTCASSPSDVPTNGLLVGLAPPATEGVMILRADLPGADQDERREMLRRVTSSLTMVITQNVDEPLFQTVIAPIHRAEPLCYAEYGRDFRNDHQSAESGVTNYRRLSVWFTKKPLDELRSALDESARSTGGWRRVSDRPALYIAEVTEELVLDGVSRPVREDRVVALPGSNAAVVGEDEADVRRIAGELERHGKDATTMPVDDGRCIPTEASLLAISVRQVRAADSFAAKVCAPDATRGARVAGTDHFLGTYRDLLAIARELGRADMPFNERTGDPNALVNVPFDHRMAADDAFAWYYYLCGVQMHI